MEEASKGNLPLRASLSGCLRVQGWPSFWFCGGVRIADKVDNGSYESRPVQHVAGLMTCPRGGELPTPPLPTPPSPPSISSVSTAQLWLLCLIGSAASSLRSGVAGHREVPRGRKQFHAIKLWLQLVINCVLSTLRAKDSYLS
jgi:hypothetical protein